MFRVRYLCLALALVLLVSPVLAAEVDSDAVYTFSSGDFSSQEEEETLMGICITGLPNPQTGTMMLGSRVLQEGDILSTQQINQMTFVPLPTENDVQAEITFLPIYENRVEAAATMHISVWGKEDLAPVAEDSVMETYKNLPNQGKLKASDPEGKALTYSILRQPKRGTLELKEDGSFTYTPKNNKVGVDSFTYTATDPAGNVSREATVTIQILKPQAGQYTDTVGEDCRFSAEWLKNQGIFVGETLGGKDCFFPDKTVSRGEFVAMLVKLLDISMDAGESANISEDMPQWLRPYLNAAMRSGLTADLPELTAETLSQPITGEEVAVMLQNALDLAVPQQALETAMQNPLELEEWAAADVYTMAQYDISLTPGEALTRGQAAQVLYQVNYLSIVAPGAAVLRYQN